MIICFPSEEGIRSYKVTGVQTCGLPILDEIVHAQLVRFIRWSNVETAIGPLPVVAHVLVDVHDDHDALPGIVVLEDRSEERRVGKEGLITTLIYGMNISNSQKYAIGHR